jgi:hypothetical protein
MRRADAASPLSTTQAALKTKRVSIRKSDGINHIQLLVIRFIKLESKQSSPQINHEEIVLSLRHRCDPTAADG